MTKGSTRVSVTIDNPNYRVNGRDFPMDARAFILGDRTMELVRFVAEAFHVDVKWRPPQTVKLLARPSDD